MTLNGPALRERWTYSALAVGTPKMPGEPPRVQPSKKNTLNWEDDGMTRRE